MGVPPAFLALLQSINIVQLPAHASPGDLIKPVLSVDLGTAFDPLQQAQTIASVALNLALTDIDFFPKQGANDVEVVLKAVEFATDPTGKTASQLDTAESVSKKLAYTFPTVVAGSIVPQLGQLVEGLGGKLASNLQMAGNIAGNIVGDIKTPAVLSSFQPPTITWHVRDTGGNDLKEGVAFVSDTSKTLLTAAPTFAFLPQFVELGSSGGTPFSEVLISADLSFPDINGQPFTFTVGPVSLNVAQVPIPTVAVLTQNPFGFSFPGLVMVAVPSSSAIGALTAISGALTPVKNVMTAVAGIASQLSLNPADAALVGIFTGSLSLISTLLTTVNSLKDPNAFVIADQIMDFSSVEVSASGCGAFGWFACHMNDRTSAILMIGPPTRSATFFNRFNLWVGTGSFSVTLGMEAAAVLPDLTAAPTTSGAAGTTGPATPVPTPPAGPTLSTFTILTPVTGQTTFDSVISSMKFNP